MFNLIPFLTFILIAAFTPGPNNCMALSYATRGMKSGVTFSLGTFGGMLIVMSACGLFSNILAEHIHSAEFVMKSIGCAYMVWLAWSLWKSKGVSGAEVQSGGRLLFIGCVLQLVNPKIIIYGLTAFSVFILPFYHEGSTLAYFAILLAVVGFLGTFTWAICGVALQSFFRQHPVMINRILVVMVLGCAVSMIV